MSWNYRVLKEKVDSVDIFRKIEVTYDDNGNILGWLNNTANILIWSNLDDLKGTVEFLSGAFQKPVLIKGKEDILKEE